MIEKHAQIYARLYRQLFRIRRVEEEIALAYPTDKIKSPVHLSIGQEAVAVGVCDVLRDNDVAFGSYRCHAFYLAKGGDLNKMIAELYGKVTGCARGKGGSMHLVDVAHGVMGASAVVGTTIANAVGYAYALKLQRKNAVVVSFFGDGATEEGGFHESMNFASLKDLPIVFICENNLYAIHTHLLRRRKSSNICVRALSYDMPAELIEGNDVLRIREKVSAVVDALRKGAKGPFFFECMTYRFREHVGPYEDFHVGYRSREEAEPWLKNDPVNTIGKLIDPELRQRIESEAEAEIREAFLFAEKSSFPDERELFTDVFEA